MQEDRSTYKRLFIGFDIECPWPNNFPAGRILNSNDRHLTMAFLGQAPFEKTLEFVHSLSLPFKVGLAGQFNRCLLLPPKQPHVLAWNIDWFENNNDLLGFWRVLTDQLKLNQLPVSENESFLPHVTLSRMPFIVKDWEKAFTPLPFIAKNLHLYESLGHSTYKSCWKLALKPPFNQITSTSFQLHGNSIEQLYLHAQVALSFLQPKFLPFIRTEIPSDNLLEVKFELINTIERHQDEIQGVFKSVDFEQAIRTEEDGTLTWMMEVQTPKDFFRN